MAIPYAYGHVTIGRNTASINGNNRGENDAANSRFDTLIEKDHLGDRSPEKMKGPFSDS